MNPMREVFVEKVVVHMGVGEAGDKLTRAVDLLKTITGNTPVRSNAKRTNVSFGIRKGAPISCRVTLRGRKAAEFLNKALDIVDRRIARNQFDRWGNFSFGIEEHTDFPGMSYDPQIGIYGMDINVVLARRGVRVTRRSIEQRRLPVRQRVTQDDAARFLKEAHRVEVY
ncbi:MAG: 50S ribosomal protein L5 [Methanolinea sp.]|nr:50S ribosomal protein L5 [Methanolinea sp.]